MAPARLLWTDGRREVRNIDLRGDEASIPSADGLPRLFSRSRQKDADGLDVWIEESRQWERFHANGRRSLVYQHADVNPGHYCAGAPLRGAAEGFTLDIGSLEEAERIADLASGCPQPCTCPPWKE